MAHPQDAPPSLGQDAFLIDQDLVYLNHAAVGPMPRPTQRAVADFCDEAMRRPTVNYGRWLKAESALRTRLARLLGGRDPADISLTGNTSQAVSLVAFGLPWQRGDVVVLPAGEFPSNRLPWLALDRFGVTIREVPLPDPTDPAPLLAACDARTRLVAASWIRYDSGERLALGPLASACRQRGIRTLIDAIQGIGAVRMPAADVDYIVGGSHKWLLGPEGVGYLWAGPEARAALASTQHGWRMLEHPFDFDRKDRRAHEDGRRFEPGTVNMMGFVALEASLALLEEVGMDRVEAAVMARAAYLLDELAKRPMLRLQTPRASKEHAGIVAVDLPGNRDAPALLHRTLQQAGVEAAVRGGYLRFSPHFHTPFADLERALRALDRALAQL